MFNTSVTSLLNKAVTLCDRAITTAQEQRKAAEVKRKELIDKARAEQEKADQAVIEESTALDMRNKLKEFIEQ